MKTITTDELQAKLQAEDAVTIIDVREVDEVAAGHIRGIINIPLSLLEFRMHELDKNKPYHIICRSGGRSGQAVALLDAYGYDVTNVAGGMLAWEGDVQ